MRMTIIMLLLSISYNLASQNEITQQFQSDEAYITSNLRPSTVIIGQENVSKTIDEMMEEFHVPGISIGVVKGGNLIWAKGYGIADTKSNKQVDTETLFQAGSISKPLAALAALQLVEMGKLDLDTDVNSYLLDWKVPSNGFDQEEKITLRRLLTHTAGVTVHGFPGYKEKDKFPSIIEVLNGSGNTDAIELDKKPGESWRYSGGGYTIMEKIVEDVSGLALEDYMDQYIFPKLGMQNSTYAQPLPEHLRGNASLAYNRKGKVIDGSFHNYPEQAAAGLWTTPTDLAKYVIAIQQILAGKEGGVISPKMATEMLTKHMGNWGLGPSLRGEGEGLIFGHGGKNAGFTNNLIAHAKKGNGIIVMTSGDNGNDIINSVQNAISEKYDMDLVSTKEIKLYPITNSEMQRLVGTYKMTDGGKWKAKVNVKEGKLVITTVFPHILEATGPLTFVDLKDPETLIFQENDKGEITGLLVQGPNLLLEREK